MTWFPEHKCGLELTHNEHKCYYETVEQYISSRNMDRDFETPEAKKRAIETDELWTLQWYPNTPVCCYVIAAPTFEELMAFAKSLTSPEHR